MYMGKEYGELFFPLQRVCLMGITGQDHFHLWVIEGTRDHTVAFGLKIWFYLCTLSGKVTCCSYLRAWVEATVMVLLEKFPLNSGGLVSRIAKPWVLDLVSVG